MDMSMLINGVAGGTISACDRGLLYGDGVFRTLRVLDGRPRYWLRHYRKLQQDCTALGITCPESALLSEELQQLCKLQADGIAKIIITRGQQASPGYAPAANTNPTRILSIFPAPIYPEIFFSHGVRLHLCKLRLAWQPKFAGIKHLNRLENVLAASEWNDADIPEGILLDEAGNVIEGTRCNLFMLRNGSLHTPDLSRCGVAGMQRERVMEWAEKEGMPCQVGHYDLKQLFDADEIFIVNSIIGLWPVRELQSCTWRDFPISRKIQKWLNHAAD